MTEDNRAVENLLERVLDRQPLAAGAVLLGLALGSSSCSSSSCRSWCTWRQTAFTATEAEAILGILSLVDLALTGSLVVIVIFSGYENFVSKIDHTEHRDWPEWMGTIDFTALKIKLLSSIVAISAIQLLKQFMSINTVSDRDLFWLVVIHVVFVVSSVLLALSDRIAGEIKARRGQAGKPPSRGSRERQS